MAKYASLLERQEQCSRMPEQLHSVASISRVRYDNFLRHPRFRTPGRCVASILHRRHSHVDPTPVPQPTIATGAVANLFAPRDVQQDGTALLQSSTLSRHWLSLPDLKSSLTSSFIFFARSAATANPAQHLCTILTVMCDSARNSWKLSARTWFKRSIADAEEGSMHPTELA